MAVDWRSALGSHRPLLLNEVAVTPSSTPRIEWPCARLAALPERWGQKCCRGSGYPVFWHRAMRRVAVALSTLHRSEQRSGDGKVGHCANLLIPHLRGNKPVLSWQGRGNYLRLLDIIAVFATSSLQGGARVPCHRTPHQA